VAKMKAKVNRRGLRFMTDWLLRDYFLADVSQEGLSCVRCPRRVAGIEPRCWRTRNGEAGNRVKKPSPCVC
jgi:hypothetical protein